MFAEKLKTRCAVLLRQNEARRRKRADAMPASRSKSRRRAARDRSRGLRDLRGRHSGQRRRPEASRRIRASKRNCRASAPAIFASSSGPTPARRPSSSGPTQRSKRRSKTSSGAIHDENTEFVTRAMEAGDAARRFSRAPSKGRDHARGFVRQGLCQDRGHRSGAVPHEIPRLG